MTKWHDFSKTKPKFKKDRRQPFLPEFLCVVTLEDAKGEEFQALQVCRYDLEADRFFWGENVTHWCEIPKLPEAVKEK